MKKGGTMFSQAVDELSEQRGGELKELIGVEERSHRAVQTLKKEAQRGAVLMVTDTEFW